MSDWRPLKEYLAEAKEAMAQAPEIPGNRSSYTARVTGLTTVLVIFLGLFVGMELLSIASDMGQMTLLNSAPFGAEAAEANDARQQMIGLIYLVVYVATVIVFGIWIHRANANARGFGAQWMEYTPGWAVGWYFVPLANLVKPFRAMKEIWNASTDPRGGYRAGSPLLGLWWGLWLMAQVSGNISARISMAAKTVEELKVSTSVSIASSLAGIALGVTAIVLVRRIAVKQARLAVGG